MSDEEREAVVIWLPPIKKLIPNASSFKTDSTGKRKLKRDAKEKKEIQKKSKKENDLQRQEVVNEEIVFISEITRVECDDMVLGQVLQRRSPVVSSATEFSQPTQNSQSTLTSNSQEPHFDEDFILM